MVDFFYNREKNIGVAVYSNEMTSEDPKKLKRLFSQHFRDLRDIKLVAIHLKDTYITDKNFSTEMAAFANEFSHSFTDLYVTGLQGIQKFFFRMYTKFVKQNFHYHVVEIQDVEDTLDINLELPLKNFEEIS